MAFFITQFIVAFVTIFLRGLQTHNVIRGEYKQAAATSIAMSICNVVTIGLIASNPWDSLVPVAMGSVMGVLSSMYIKRRNV